jgi:hypothetical protein
MTDAQYRGFCESLKILGGKFQEQLHGSASTYGSPILQVDKPRVAMAFFNIFDSAFTTLKHFVYDPPDSARRTD